MEKEVPRIHESELKVLAIIWRHGERSAGDIATELMNKIGWKRNTTYTIITKLIDKGIIERIEPGYICRALYSQDEVIVSETKSLLGKIYDGSLSMLVTAFMKKNELSKQDIQELRQLLDEKEEGNR
ncbi:MAG: BlaI/MecI/CopY family transcriptional regulator [Bacillaceae bacterium]